MKMENVMFRQYNIYAAWRGVARRNDLCYGVARFLLRTVSVFCYRFFLPFGSVVVYRLLPLGFVFCRDFFNRRVLFLSSFFLWLGSVFVTVGFCFRQCFFTVGFGFVEKTYRWVLFLLPFFYRWILFL